MLKKKKIGAEGGGVIFREKSQNLREKNSEIVQKMKLPPEFVAPTVKQCSYGKDGT